jgi:Putative esterase
VPVAARVRTLVRMMQLIFALMLTASASSASAQMKVVSEGRAIQPRTDELLIHSERIGRDFLVEVTLLDQVQPGRRYAAVYALDGGLGIVGPASRLLVAGRRTVPFFVVAIGYPNAVARHLGQRNTDLVHRRVKFDDGREFGGGGGAFEAFIMQDLRPYLEQRYPLDPKRAVLFGHSGGGLFTATVLVTNPDAFHAYVIGGLPIRMPDLAEDSPLPQQAKVIAPRGRGQRVYIGFAPLDALNNAADRFAAPLSGPESKFKVLQERYEEETHNSEYLQLIARGLPFVLPTETSQMVATAVAREVLDRHVGVYRMDVERVLEITRNGNQLLARIDTGGQKGGLFPLAAASDTRFFSQATDSILTFDPPVNGKSPRLLARTVDEEAQAERVR